LQDLGVAREDRGEYDTAEAHLTRSLDRFTRPSDNVNVLIGVYHLGVVAYGRGETVRARQRWEETLAAARARGELVVAAWCLEHLGLLAAEQGDVQVAAAALGEWLVLGTGAAYRHARGPVLAALAVLGDACGQSEEAARLLGAADAAAAATGWRMAEPPEGMAYERAAARLRAALGEAAYEQAVAAGRGQGAEAIAAHVDAVLGAASTANGPAPDGHGLTSRELEVLRLLAEGRTDRDIAGALFISRRTASNHVAAILAKLDVSDRRAAAAAARSFGVVPATASGRARGDALRPEK
jgi:DNA-binding CsgD family transcriptional regulator